MEEQVSCPSAVPKPLRRQGTDVDCKMKRRPSSEEAESRAGRGRSAVCGSRECWRIAFIAAKFCALFRCAKFKDHGNGTLTVTMWRSMDEQVGVSRVAFGGEAPSQPQRGRFFCSMDKRKPTATSPKTPSLWIQRSSQPREQAKQFPGPSGKGNPELGERWGPRGRDPRAWRDAVVAPLPPTNAQGQSCLRRGGSPSNPIQAAVGRSAGSSQHPQRQGQKARWLEGLGVVGNLRGVPPPAFRTAKFYGHGPARSVKPRRAQ